MPGPAPCAPRVWRGRAAEELLNIRERRVSYQDPIYVARPRPKNISGSPSAASLRPQNNTEKQKNASAAAQSAAQAAAALKELQMERLERFVHETAAAEPTEADSPKSSDREGLLHQEFSRSSSAPLLKPLAPPALQDSSPFAASLGFLTKEPPEFSIQRDTAKRRDAAKLLRKVYRSAIESLGHQFFQAAPWPPKQVQRPDPVTSKPKVSPLTQPPFALIDEKRHRKEETSHESTRPSQSPGKISKRKETIQFMKTFGRGALGGPYTIGQVHQEVEADIHHRYPADVRALSGTLGPAILGLGTTRMRRKLPFTHPQLAISN